MVDVNIEITSEDSPIPNVLDQFYTHVHSLLSPQTEQKVALNSTLVTFDILPEAPMFTEYVFRAFADRTITASPTDFEPVALGVANTNDRYSTFYTELLRQSIFDLDATMSDEALDKIDILERDIQVLRKDMQKFIQDMFRDWNAHAKENGIEVEDPYYLDKQTAYFTVFNFADQLQYYRETIGDNLQKIFRIRDQQYPDPESRQIANLLKHATLAQYLMPRPKDPSLEEVNNYGPIELGQAYIYNNLSYFETSVDIHPSGFLPKFLDTTGKRNMRVSEGETQTLEHDSSWSASGSARKFLFFKASANASYEKHIRESVDSTVSIDIGFENIAEYWVNRGSWFASNIFDYERVQDVLSDNPRLAAMLSHCISSLVLARGMSVTYNFSKETSFKEWSKFTSSSSGSFSIFGMSIPSSSGSYSSYDMNTRISEDNKSVTFFDDPNHVRLIGFKVDKMFDGGDELRLAHAKYWDEVNLAGDGNKSRSLSMLRESIKSSQDLKLSLINDGVARLRG